MTLRGEQGSALLVSMLLLMLAQALLVAVTSRAILSAHAVRRLEDRVLALNAAEAGLAQACQVLHRDGYVGREAGTLGTSDYAVTVEQGDQEGPWRDYTMVSRGDCRAQHRTLQLRVEVLFDELGTAIAMRRIDWTPLPG